ncbi:MULTISPECIES: DUF3906 family protein [unclassified Sporolactobacillus]|uniref:DUF3906 family protein n=1 Tax=unclassified Sporolactobacillus TaxID=2628533 RepID=UPI002367D3B2|nr:DUF3906 family protein [Sporolactobacillus sp. CQH2019]MDD9148694.1 DUF3906 family protein [Sporolactobacillus sp. CQH2019]
MELFRFIVTSNENETVAVAVAENEEAAFRVVDSELQRTFLKRLKVDSIVLLEKKKIGKSGAGFVIRPRETYE